MRRDKGFDMGGDRGNGTSNRLGPLFEDDHDVISKGEAFLSRFRQAEPRIFAYILTLLPHREDAEDVLQEVSLIMWEKLDARDPPEDFVAWGCRIAYFRVLLHQKKKRRQRVLFSETILDHLAKTMAEEDRALRLDERLEALARCFGKLGRGDRELLVERLKEGATTRSTAERIGRSVDTVYKAMARIRKAVFDCVARAIGAEEGP